MTTVCKKCLVMALQVTIKYSTIVVVFYSYVVCTPGYKNYYLGQKKCSLKFKPIILVGMNISGNTKVWFKNCRCCHKLVICSFLIFFVPQTFAWRSPELRHVLLPTRGLRSGRSSSADRTGREAGLRAGEQRVARRRKEEAQAASSPKGQDERFELRGQ